MLGNKIVHTVLNISIFNNANLCIRHVCITKIYNYVTLYAKQNKKLLVHLFFMHADKIMDTNVAAAAVSILINKYVDWIIKYLFLMY